MAVKEDATFDLKISAVDKFSPAFKKLGDAVEKAGEKAGDTAKELGKFEKAANKLGFEKLKKAAGECKQSFSGIKPHLTSFAKRFAVIGAAVGGFTFALYKLTRSYTDYADASIKTAQKAGVSLQNFQEMAHAAELSGVSNEDLTGSYGKLNQMVSGFIKGEQASKDIVKALGIEMMTADGKVKTTNDLYLELADTFSKMPAGAEKNALAMKVFGDAGMKLMPMLNNGKAGLQDLAREANNLGLVMSEEDARASENFNDDMSRLQTRFKGLAMTVGKAVMPVMHDLIKFFSELIDENRELFKTKVTEWAKKLAAFMPKVKVAIRAVVAVFKGLVLAGLKIVDFFGGFETVALVLATILAGPLVKAVLGMIGPIKKLALAFLSTPIGWIAIAVAGIVLLMKKFGVLDPAIQAVKTAFKGFLGQMEGKFQPIMDAVAPMIEDIKNNLLSIDWEAMGKAVAEFAAKAIEAIGPVMTMIAAMMAKLAESYTMLLEVVSGAAYKDAENATERAQEVMTNQNRFALASRQEGISDKQRYINQRLVSEEAFREKNNGITKGAAYYAAQWDREHPEQAAGAPAMQAPQAGPPAMQGGAEPQVLKEEKVVTTTNKVDIKVSALPGSEVQTSVTGDAENVKVKGGGANLGAANEY